MTILNEELKTIRPDIQIIQEIRQKINNTVRFNYVNKTRLYNRNNEQTRVGGGVCIGIRADLTYEDKTNIFQSHE